MNDEILVKDMLLSDIMDVEHSGIKGMRWGIRRFQNEDGTLTEEGKLRYYGTSEKIDKRINAEFESLKKRLESEPEFSKKTASEKEDAYKELKSQAELIAKSKIMQEAELAIMKDADAYAVAKVEAGKKVLESTSDIFGKAGALVPDVKGTSSYPDYSNISTEELRKRTERLNAEKNYAIASGQMIYVPSKQEITHERLQTMAAVTGILGSVAAIGVTLSNLKHFSGSGGGKGTGG